MKKEEVLIKYLQENFSVKIPEKRKVVEVFIKTILSQNTNDRNRDRAYENLTKSFGNWKEVLNAPLRKVEKTIREAGLARQKASTIKRFLRKVYETWGKFEIDDEVCRMEKEEFKKFFLSIKGIGIKTVSVALIFGCGKEVFPVDTHIYRVSRRLGLIPEDTSREKAHALLDALFPPSLKLSLHLQMIEFGRKVCRARNPACEECGLTSICGYASKINKT